MNWFRTLFHLILLLLVFCALLIGCGVPAEVKTKTHEQRVIVETYVEKYMNNGQTSQEQDQKVIRECHRTLLILDWGLNDDKEAKKKLDALDKPDDGGGGG